jgi:hypothetical protein
MKLGQYYYNGDPNKLPGPLDGSESDTINAELKLEF